jgi:hypothetical protein
MSTTIHAHFDGKFFVPDEPVSELQPGDRVQVVIIPSLSGNGSTELHVEKDPLLGLIDLAVDTGIPDLAENADHHLYGHPKQSDQIDGR